jgi:sterol desaturase/sphingolipid hydroxylase (fatty acid hydroxylase superfamily)
MLARLAVALLILVALVTNPDDALLVPFLFVVVVPFEKLFPRHPQKVRRPGLGTDLAWGLSQPVVAVAGLVVALAVGALSLAWLPGLALRPLVLALPSPLQVVLGALLFDVTFYWTHRWSHEVPFLWRFHVVHHSTRHLDWVSGLRNHPLDGVFLAPGFFLLLAAGFSLQLTGILLVVQLLLGIFLHANVRWRLRPLHKLVITPEFHHWHHADEPDAHNTNYSVFLPVWDLLFGTYYLPADRRPQVYGVHEPLPEDFAGQLLHPLREAPSPLLVARHPVRTTRFVRAGLRRGLGQLRASACRT